MKQLKLGLKPPTRHGPENRLGWPSMMQSQSEVHLAQCPSMLQTEAPHLSQYGSLLLEESVAAVPAYPNRGARPRSAGCLRGERAAAEACLPGEVFARSLRDAAPKLRMRPCRPPCVGVEYY